MGIVIKQGFYNSLWMAIGIAIGYVNMVLLFPVFLTADQFGLTRVLWAAGTVFGQFALLGSPQILVKFFPDISTKPRQKGGFFTFMLLISLLGFLIFFLAGFVFKGQIIKSYANQSSLFGDNYTYIYVITFFFIYFNILEAYLRASLKTTVASFLKNTMIRIIWLALIVLYEQKLINFETFIFWFVSAYGIILLMLIIYTIYIGQLKISLRLSFLTPRQIKSMGVFGFYVILGGSTAYLGNYLDVLMVGGMINLQSVAFYSVAFYLGSVILLPFNGITNILAPIISEAFSKNDLSKIKDAYQGASINLSLVSMLLFLGIWLNVNDLFRLLPSSYAEGKYVLLFIALGKLYNASMGINFLVLQYSKYFKMQLWFNTIFLVFLVISNYLMIPLWGITGAALATFLSQILITSLQVIYIYMKMGILPVRKRNLKVLVLAGGIYFVIQILPVLQNIILDIAFRSLVIIILYLPLAFFWNVSNEYTGFAKKYLKLAAHYLHG